MKELTRAQEQVMQYMWKLEKAFLKDIVEAFPEPRPAYTTVSTVVRKLVEEKFIGFKAYGKVREYFPLVSKEAYFKKHIKRVMNSFFNGSISKLTSAFTADEDLDLSELEQMKQLIEAKIKKLKANGE